MVALLTALQTALPVALPVAPRMSYVNICHYTEKTRLCNRFAKSVTVKDLTAVFAPAHPRFAQQIKGSLPAAAPVEPSCQSRQKEAQTLCGQPEPCLRCWLYDLPFPPDKSPAI